MAEMIRLTIDGKEVEVEKGTPVIQAAFKTGAKVPHYCYHQGLTIAGNCRMCLVEIEKMPKLVTSCTTPAGDGMVVHTNSEKVKEAVAGVEEFLLANHPLDCPICDQAGECKLQEYSYKHGKAESRFGEERLQFKKGLDIGSHVVLDCERCIVCTRCVRFCEEVTQTGELGVFQRGLHNEIGIFPGRRLENAYSGNVVDICPVGALTLKEFRFRKRVWFIRDVPSVCGGCSQGCNLNMGTNRNEVWRLTPRENSMVNGWWMCDEGRLSFKQFKERGRQVNAEVRTGGAWSPLRLPDAASRIAESLKGAGSSAAAIASGSLTVEDFWILKKVASQVASGMRIVVPERVRGEDDGFLIRADRRANRRGAELLGLEVDSGGEASRALIQEISSGKVRTLLVLGEDLSTLEGAEAALSALGQGGTLIVIDPFLSETGAKADLRLPAAAWSEFEGTWVNTKGRAQRVRRGVTPRSAALPYWQILSLVLKKAGADAPWQSAAQVLREVAGEAPPFKEVTWTALGAEGRQLDLGPDAPAPEPAPKGLPQAAWATPEVARG